MTFLSFSAALLYFETPDELLHLYTPQHVKERMDGSGIMHIPSGNGQRLIEVPFARAAQPFWAQTLNRTPSTAIQTQQEQRRIENTKRCDQVVDALTDKPYQVLRAIAQGLHPNDVAKKLGIKPSTIQTHINVIYRECRNVWNLSETVQVNYLFIQARFAGYFSDEESIPSG